MCGGGVDSKGTDVKDALLVSSTESLADVMVLLSKSRFRKENRFQVSSL